MFPRRARAGRTGVPDAGYLKPIRASADWTPLETRGAGGFAAAAAASALVAAGVPGAGALCPWGAADDSGEEVAGPEWAAMAASVAIMA